MIWICLMRWNRGSSVTILDSLVHMILEYMSTEHSYSVYNHLLSSVLQSVLCTSMLSSVYCRCRCRGLYCITPGGDIIADFPAFFLLPKKKESNFISSQLWPIHLTFLIFCLFGLYTTVRRTISYSALSGYCAMEW